MAEAEGIPPTASVASVGPNLRYVGQFAYGYSGRIAVGNSEILLMDFITGSGLITAKVQFFYAVDTSQNPNFAYTIKINGAVVSKYVVNGSSTYTSANNPVFLVIPPESHIELIAQNVEDSSTLTQSALITGKVHGAF